MLRVLDKTFTIIKRVSELLEKRIYKDFNLSLIIFFFIFFVFGGMGYFIKSQFNSDLGYRITTVLIGIYIYLLIPFAFYKYEKVRKYIIFGKIISYSELLSNLSFISYLHFIIRFSFVLVYSLAGLVSIIVLLGLNPLDFFYKNIYFVLIVIISIESIIWFSYHITKSIELLSRIKKELSFYVAIVSTLSFIAFPEQFKLIISCLVISYFWVQFLIDSKEYQLDTIKKNKQNINNNVC